jgi:3-dehydroquinate synthetase
VTPAALVDDVRELLRALGLPTDLRGEPLAEALGLLSLDKKRRGDALKLVLVSAPGEIRIATTALSEVRRLALEIVS